MIARIDRRSAALAVLTFALLVFIAFGTTGWVRGSLGDLVVVVWVASCLGTLLHRWAVCSGLALALATVLECGQLLGSVGPDDPLWMHLIFGSTFDPLDLLHYAIGAVLAWALLAVGRSTAVGPSPAAGP